MQSVVEAWISGWYCRVESGQLQKLEWEEGWTSSWYCKEEESGEVYIQVAEQNGKKAGQQAGITEQRHREKCLLLGVYFRAESRQELTTDAEQNGKKAGKQAGIAEQRAGTYVDAE